MRLWGENTLRQIGQRPIVFSYCDVLNAGKLFQYIVYQYGVWVKSMNFVVRMSNLECNWDCITLGKLLNSSESQVLPN